VTFWWQEPRDTNCQSITSYETRYPILKDNALSGTDLTRDIVVDGDVSLSFFVIATNNEGFSSAIFSQTITSPALRKYQVPRLWFRE